MLRASQKRGKNDTSYVQFDMVRKIRTAFATVYESSAAAGVHTDTFKGAHGNTFALNKASTDSHLFRKFMVGLENLMGRLVIQNAGISVELLLAILDVMEEEYICEGVAATRKQDLIMCGSAFAVLFSAAL